MLFSFIYENAKPDTETSINRAWYVATPNSFREGLNDMVRSSGVSDTPPFLVARVVTVGLFLSIGLLLLLRLRNRLSHIDSPNHELLETIFLTIALFFVTQPTQNPWYWVWAMPFACFARNRGWLFVGAFLFVYYLRFVFKFSEYEFSFAGFDYQQAGIFDHCVAWIEHLAIFAAVGIGALMNRPADKANGSIIVD